MIPKPDSQQYDTGAVNIMSVVSAAGKKPLLVQIIFDASKFDNLTDWMLEMLYW